jgi:hypothetical protein
LIAESELNRVQLAWEWGVITVDVRTFTEHVKTCGSLASSAALLVAGLAAFRHGKCVDADAKPSWLQTVVKRAGLVSTLWLAFRSQHCDRDGI